MRAAIRVSLFIALILPMSGCEREEPPVPEQVRPIRAFTVNEVASGQQRRFPGVIEASDSSSLSFQVGGNVRQVRVSQGDSVRAGQVLAVLDEEPFRLAVQSAEAELQRARAYLAQTRADFERHQRLLAQRAVARVAFEVAQRNYESSQSQIDVANARLALARRDLRNATLTAPFDGSIAARRVDPFTEVRAGQELFRIDAAGNRQAAIGVPQTTIAHIVAGMPATVNVPQVPQPIAARVSEIGSAAGAGNMFPVKLTLIDPPAAVRPGMTADVTLTVAQDTAISSYFVPLAAIAPGDGTGDGFLFVYDPASSTVRRTQVRAAGALASNMVAVTGVAAGDIIATAGVNFLVDGQRVTLMAEPGPEAGRTGPTSPGSGT